ncbi:MAG: flagellar biosynthetic protein FliO [Pseudomonadota bacterium]
MRLLRHAIAIMALPGASLFASAAQAQPAAVVTSPGGAEILSFVGSLGLVIASILAFGWLYSRFRPGMHQGSELIRLVAMRPIGPKERLLVVEVAGEQLLVGVSAAGMRTLHKIDEPITAGEGQPAESGFALRLKSLLGERAQ